MLSLRVKFDVKFAQCLQIARRGNFEVWGFGSTGNPGVQVRTPKDDNRELNVEKKGKGRSITSSISVPATRRICISGRRRFGRTACKRRVGVSDGPRLGVKE